MEGSEGEEVVEGEFLGTELHLAEVDDAVGAPDEAARFKVAENRRERSVDDLLVVV